LQIRPEVQQIDPKLFYIIEQARDMSNVYRPIFSSLGGWRAINKHK
jgi:hypothetical protein